MKRLAPVARWLLVVLFVLASAAAFAHGHATGNEFQLFRGVVYAFAALALLVSRHES